MLIIDYSKYNKNLNALQYNDNFKFKSNTIYPALIIDFKNDYKYSISVIKKLDYLINFKKINFQTIFNNENISFIIANYSADIINALELLYVSDQSKRIEYVYNNTFNKLDYFWQNNPCDFCNNECIASRKGFNYHKYDGCCYSFEYDYRLFSKSFIKNIHKCQYLGTDKKCKTQNISCRLFVCKYLKKFKHLNIDLHNFLLVQCFYSKKQKLIIQDNFFKSKEEIIEKLNEENHTPYLLYNIFCLYRIKGSN